MDGAPRVAEHLLRRVRGVVRRVAGHAGVRRLEEAERKFSPRRVTFLEGLPGNLALQAAVRLRLRDRRGALALAARVGHILELVLCLEQGECEVLYGRCGYLGAIPFLRKRQGRAGALVPRSCWSRAPSVAHGGRLW